MILADTNILLRSLHTADPHYAITENSLMKLRSRQEVLCIAPQNIIEFWSVATRPASENGFGLSVAKAEAEIATVLRLFHLLPYKAEALDAWRRIVLAHGVVGKQTHDAHIVAMMEVHSVTSLLTFNGAHFMRYPGITVLNPAEM